MSQIKLIVKFQYYVISILKRHKEFYRKKYYLSQGLNLELIRHLFQFNLWTINVFKIYVIILLKDSALTVFDVVLFNWFIHTMVEFNLFIVNIL